MADEMLSALSQTFTSGYSTSDVMLLLDVLDTTMASTGTDKGIAVSTFLAQYLHAGSNVTLTPGSTGVTIASAGGGGGAVSSVFTRTGAVVATSGDYTVAQVTGAAPLASPTFTGSVTLPAGTVTLAEHANLAADSLMGNPTGSPAAPSAITLGSGLAFSGTTLVTSGTVPVTTGGTGLGTLTAHAVMLGEGVLNVGFATIGTAGRLLIDQGSGADPAFEAMSGDVAITSAGATTVQAGAISTGKLAASAVTYAKMQATSAGSVLLGNPTGSAAVPSEITLGANLSFSGTTLVAAGGGGSGTVTSVSWTGDGTLFTSTATTAITTSGTLTPGTGGAGLIAQAKNTLFSGPTTGSNAAPTFRTAVQADLTSASPISSPGAGTACEQFGASATTGTSGSTYSTSLGNGATCGGGYATAIGAGAQATSLAATSVGQGATSGSGYTTILGSGATANGTASYAIVIGRQSQVTANYGIAIGYTAVASTANTCAIGSSVGVINAINVATSAGTINIVPAYNLYTGAQTLTALNNTVAVSAAGSAWALTLPAANAVPAGKEYIIKKVDANTTAITVTAAGSDTIDAASTYVLSAQWQYVRIVSTGGSPGNWMITGIGST